MHAIVIPPNQITTIFFIFPAQSLITFLLDCRGKKKIIKIERLRVLGYYRVIVINDFYKPRLKNKTDGSHKNDPQIFRPRKICGKKLRSHITPSSYFPADTQLLPREFYLSKLEDHPH
jgi:hypothetical protein